MNIEPTSERMIEEYRDVSPQLCSKAGWLFPEGDVAAMAALITSLGDKSSAGVREVVEEARTIALEEINRDNTADDFHHLFTKPLAG